MMALGGAYKRLGEEGNNFGPQDTFSSPGYHSEQVISANGPARWRFKTTGTGFCRFVANSPQPAWVQVAEWGGKGRNGKKKQEAMGSDPPLGRKTFCRHRV